MTETLIFPKAKTHNTLQKSMTHHQPLGGDALRGVDADEVGAGGPSADVEVYIQAVGALRVHQHAAGIVDLHHAHAEAGDHPGLLSGGVGHHPGEPLQQVGLTDGEDGVVVDDGVAADNRRVAHNQRVAHGYRVVAQDNGVIGVDNGGVAWIDNDGVSGIDTGGVATIGGGVLRCQDGEYEISG